MGMGRLLLASTARGVNATMAAVIATDGSMCQCQSIESRQRKRALWKVSLLSKRPGLKRVCDGFATSYARISRKVN